MANPKTAQRITAWSPSRLATWEGCPRQAKFKFIEKRPEPKSPAAERGASIHKDAEDYTKGLLRRLPLSLKPVAAHMKELREGFKRGEVTVEGELAFDDKWQPVGWFDHNVWCRVKTDALQLAAGVIDITDHKTGKVREKDDYVDQLDIYRVAGLSLNLGAREARSRLLFIDHNVVIPSDKPLKLAELPKQQKRWAQRAGAMLRDTRFVPRPGEGCRWCAWSRKRGGPCEY